MRQDYDFGDRLEYDFGEVKLVINGITKKYYIVIFSSPARNFSDGVIFMIIVKKMYFLILMLNFSK